MLYIYAIHGALNFMVWCYWNLTNENEFIVDALAIVNRMYKRLPVAWVVPSYVGVCHQEDYCKKIKIPIQNKNIYCSKIWLYNQNKV